MPEISIKDKITPILELEKEILKLPQIEMPLTEEFCDRLYARTMTIPANTIATGAIHSGESFFIVRKGKILITSESGGIIMNAGDMSVTTAYEKRAVIAITDCVLTTIHPNESNERDSAKLFSMHTISPDLLLEDKQ